MARGARRVFHSIAVALAVAMMGAPLSGPLHAAQQCVGACPMHARHKPGCHGSAVTAAPADTSSASCASVAIAPPGCACKHKLPTWSVVPAVLAPSVVASIVPLRRASPTGACPWQVRAADPPDSPPPILAA